MANGTKYGLAGYLWTNDLQRAHRVAAQLDAGSIGLNSIPLVPANAPFGGYEGQWIRPGGRSGGLGGVPPNEERPPPDEGGAALTPGGPVGRVRVADDSR